MGRVNRPPVERDAGKISCGVERDGSDETNGIYFAKIERRVTEIRNIAARVAAILAPAPGRSM